MIKVVTGWERVNKVFTLCSSSLINIHAQGFSYLSEVGARGLLNSGEKAFGSSKLGKFDAV